MGGGVLGVRTPPFGGPLNFIKRGKNVARENTKKRRDLVLNSYSDPPPLSEIIVYLLMRVVLSVRNFLWHS